MFSKRTVPDEAMIRTFSMIALLLVAPIATAAETAVFPGRTWEHKTPASVGLDAAKLAAISDDIGGRGCVVRFGYMVYTWGDPSLRGDVASAAKPWFSHFLFKAIENGRIATLDDKLSEWEPRLTEINAALGYKDRQITWRHVANQTSAYGVLGAPGTVFCYNDWQMALFWDTLFLKVYGTSNETVDAKVLHPLLTDVLQCEDNPTLMACGGKDQAAVSGSRRADPTDNGALRERMSAHGRPPAGRVGVSVRDFARFGLLYLNEGNWNGRQLISREHARMAVSQPLPARLPRAIFSAAEMIPGQRTIGSRRIPDNSTHHFGSYSWLWWTNGVDAAGQRHWADVPVDAYAALGHGGLRAMIVVPSLALILSWNDTRIRGKEMEKEALKRFVSASGWHARTALAGGQGP